MDKETESSNYKQSSYNSAGNTIKRLDTLWEAAHKDVRETNYLDWNILLDRLWLEVAGDLKEDSPENQAMEEFNKKIVKLLPLSIGNLHGFNKRSDAQAIKVSKQYLLLRKKERLVKFMENKLGLGKSYVDELEDDWD